MKAGTVPERSEWLVPAEGSARGGAGNVQYPVDILSQILVSFCDRPMPDTGYKLYISLLFIAFEYPGGYRVGENWCIL